MRKGLGGGATGYTLAEVDENSSSHPSSSKAPVPVSGELRETLRWTTGSLRKLYGSRLRRLILVGSQARSNQQIRALQEKAGQALPDAELLLGSGSVEVAINRGYYAAFQNHPRFCSEDS